MAVVYERILNDDTYQVRSAGRSVRLYTNGVFHSQFNPARPVSGNVWDLLMLPAFFYLPGEVRNILLLGVGGGAVIRQLRYFLPDCSITGVELSAECLRIARRFFGVGGRGIALHRADARHWLHDYRGPAFDMIIDDLFTGADGEPQRAVAADREWVKLLTGHLSDHGIAVSNFADRAELDASAWLRDRGIRKSFACAFVLSTAQNHNAVGAFLRRTATPRQLRRHLQRIPELDPRRPASRNRYQVRTLRLVDGAARGSGLRNK